MDDDDDDDGDGDGDGDGGDDVVEISSVQVPGSKSTFPRSTPVPVSVGGPTAGGCHGAVPCPGTGQRFSVAQVVSSWQAAAV